MVLGLATFSNGPYWSLPYEFWYYAIFASVYFLKGRKRILVAFLTALIAGLRILLAFPIWLMGVAAYSLMKPITLRPWLGPALWLVSSGGLLVAILVQSSWLDLHIPGGFLAPSDKHPVWNPYVTPPDFIAAGFFATNFLAIQYAEGMFLQILMWLRAPIRRLAGMTFSLNLFHMPLLQLFAAISPWPRTTWSNGFFVLVGAMSATTALSYISERRRDDWKILFSRVLARRRPGQLELR